MTGVSAGKIAADSYDAVNGSQLYKLQQDIKTLSGGSDYLDVNAADDPKDDAALTFSAKAKGAHSLAVGKDAVASGANSIAIGEGSEAVDPNTFSVGRVGKAATDTEAEVPAIKRRIVNVADGEKASDSATVGQLHTVSLKAGEQYLNDTSAKDETSGITSHVLSINAASVIAADSTGLTASAGLATAEAVYDEVRPEAGEGETLKYVGKGKTTGENLKALDAQVVKNEGAIASLSTLNDKGTTAIRKAVSINKTGNGGFATVTQDDATGEYTVSVTATGTVTNDNAGEALVTGKTVKQAIDAMGFVSQSALDNYALANAGNIAAHASDWASALSKDVKVGASGTTGSGLLVTGAAVYNEVRKDGNNADLSGTYVRSNKTTGQNLKDLDAQVAKNVTAISTASSDATEAKGTATTAKTAADRALAQTQYLSFNTTGADSSAATQATGNQSLAIGVGATASGVNSVAIGWGSVASAEDTFSVGSTSKQRRITNVAAGTAATDAATVGQLPTLELSGDKLSFRQQSAQGKNPVVTYKPEPPPFGDETYATLTKTPGTDGSIAYKLSLKISNSIGDFSNIPDDGCLDNCDKYYDSLATNKGVFFEVRPTANGKYVSTGKTTAENLTALDDQVSKNSGVLEYLSINPTDETLTVEPSSSAKAIGKHSVALGEEAKAALGGDNAIGYHAQATGSGSTAIGYTAKATEAWAIAIGVEAEASQQMATAIGRGAKAKGGNSNAIGTNATAEGSSSIAIGNGAKVVQDAQSAIALGAGSTANEQYTVSVGSSTQGRRIVNVAAGTALTDAATVAQLPSVSLASGQKYLTLTHADGSTDYKLALATSDNVYDSTPGLVTNVAVKNALDALSTSTAAGSNYLSVNATGNPLTDTPSTSAKATGAHALAMGEGATASGENSVALGAGSVADVAKAVSVGSTGNERRIMHVAKGIDGTDAATVAQLPSVSLASDQKYLKLAHADGSTDYQLALVTSDDVYGSTKGLVTNEAVKNALGAYAKADGSNVASDSAATWAGKIGTGKIGGTEAEGKRLVTGETVYKEVHLSTNGQYVQSTNTVAANLAALDSGAANLSNLTASGKGVIRDEARAAVKVEAGDHVKVDLGTGSAAGTYTVSVKADGTVAAGDAGKGLVTGNAVQAALANFQTGTIADYAKANGENVTDAAKWAEKIGTGKISGTEAEGKRLVTGETVYKEVHLSTNGQYVQSTNTVAANLAALDSGAANLSNLTDSGKGVIRDEARAAVKVEAGDHVKVDPGTGSAAGTYTVSVKADGTVAAGDAGKGLVTGNAVQAALANFQTGTLTDYAKANGENVTDAAKWAEKIGTGTIAKATAESKALLVTGDTVYGEVREGVTGIHVNSGNTVAQNLSALDRQVVANAGAISSLSTLNDTGRTAIRKAVSIHSDGFVSATQDPNSGVYTVSVRANGAVAEGNAGLVTGGQVQEAIANIQTVLPSELNGYAKANGDNVTDAAAWAGKIGTGKIGGTEAEGKQLVTAEKVYSEVRKDDHGVALNGTYAKSSKTTGQNLKELDEQVVANAGKIGTNATAITSLRDMDNLTTAGETKVRNLAKDSVQVKGGTNTTVTTGTDGNATTYAVNVTATGAVASGDTGIISGGKLYSEVRPTDGEYVSATKTTGQNLKDLDTQVKANFEAIGGLKDLTGISDAGKGVIRGQAIEAVKVEGSEHATVTPTEAGDGVTKTKTYKVEVTTTDTVAAGNTRIVTSDAVATAIENLKSTTAGSIADIEQSYAKLNGDNLGAGSAFNAVNWAAALSSGAVVAKDGDRSKLLVTGAALYDEVRKDKDGADLDGNYVKSNKTTGQNLKDLDAQVNANATSITANATNITKLTNLSNITDAGKTVIRDQAIGAVTLADGENTTVTSEVTESGAGQVKTYKVKVKAEGTVTENNDGIVKGGTVYAALQTLKEDTTGAITNIVEQNYAKLDGSNLSGEGSTFKADKWANALSNGVVIGSAGTPGSNLLITGARLYDEVKLVKHTRDGEAFHYIGTEYTTGSNLVALDSQLFSLSETIETFNGQIDEVKRKADAAAADATAAKADASEAKANANTALEKATSAEAKAEDAQKKHTTLVDSDHIKVTEGTNEAGGKQYSLSIAETADFTAKQTTWKDGEATSTANSSGFFSGGASAENADAYVSKGVVSAGKDAEKKIVLDGNTGKATFGKTVTIDGETGRISGVAAGDISEDSTDAVNGAQLYETQQMAAHNAESIQALGSQVTKVDRKINRTGALAAALAALHPQDYDESHPITGAAGVGHYKGKQALAVGMYVRPAENLMFSLGASASGDSDYMLNAGVSYRFGGPSLQKSPVQMAARISEQEVTIRDLAAQNQVQKTLIESQRDTLDAQKAKLETQDAKLEKQASEIEALKAMMAKIQAKLEK